MIKNLIPCPKCNSRNIKPQTPIKIPKDTEFDINNPKKLLGQYAKIIKIGETQLEGPVYFMCFDCFHKGPLLDCSGKTSEEVGQDPIIYQKMKDLWNEQK
jgi:hypothetical protein